MGISVGLRLRRSMRRSLCVRLGMVSLHSQVHLRLRLCLDLSMRLRLRRPRPVPTTCLTSPAVISHLIQQSLKAREAIGEFGEAGVTSVDHGSTLLRTSLHSGHHRWVRTRRRGRHGSAPWQRGMDGGTSRHRGRTWSRAHRVRPRGGRPRRHRPLPQPGIEASRALTHRVPPM